MLSSERGGAGKRHEKATRFTYIAIGAPGYGDVWNGDVSLEPMLNNRLWVFVFHVF